MKKPFTAVNKTWQFCGHSRTWAGATAEYINVKHKCLRAKCRTRSAEDSAPWLSSDGVDQMGPASCTQAWGW